MWGVVVVAVVGVVAAAAAVAVVVDVAAAWVWEIAVRGNFGAPAGINEFPIIGPGFNGSVGRVLRRTTR